METRSTSALAPAAKVKTLQGMNEHQNGVETQLAPAIAMRDLVYWYLKTILQGIDK